MRGRPIFNGPVAQAVRASVPGCTERCTTNVMLVDKPDPIAIIEKSPNETATSGSDLVSVSVPTPRAVIPEGKNTVRSCGANSCATSGRKICGIRGGLLRGSIGGAAEIAPPPPPASTVPKQPKFHLVPSQPVFTQRGPYGMLPYETSVYGADGRMGVSATGPRYLGPVGPMSRESWILPAAQIHAERTAATTADAVRR